VVEYCKDDGLVEYDDGDVHLERLHGDGRQVWEREAEVGLETELPDVAPLETAAPPKLKRPASPVNRPCSEPSQRRQRGSTIEPQAAATSALGAGSIGPLRFTADLVQQLPLLVRRSACPPLL
jgi:hypothetical protein